MDDYADCKYEEMKDRQMEDELDEFAELAGMPYSKAVHVTRAVEHIGDNGIVIDSREIVVVDNYPIGDKTLRAVIRDLKDGYFVSPF